MSKLINQFCRMLASLPEDSRSENCPDCTMTFCGQAIGLPCRAATPPTLREVRKRLLRLHRKAGLQAEVLVRGVLDYLIARYERLACSELLHGHIDNDLALLQVLHDDLGKPEASRAKSAEELIKLIAICKDVLSRRTADQKRAEYILERLEGFSSGLHFNGVETQSS